MLVVGLLCMALGPALWADAQTPDTTSMTPEELGIVDGEFALNLESLRGIEKVALVIRDLTEEVESDGLYAKDIHFNVSLQLVRAGIDIISPMEYENHEDIAHLYIHVTTLRFGLNYIYNLGVALSQDVTLVRDPELIISGATWRTDELGLLPTGQVGSLLESVTEKVDEFIADHAASNADPEE